MKILRRYVLREHLGPFVAALGVLTGLMLLNQLARRFSDLVGKGLPWYVIGEVFALSVPFILAMTMPMAVLVAVLYTYSRLSSDNEITAIKAGGVSLWRMMIPVLLASTVLAAGMVGFNDKILPESNHSLRKLLTDIGRKQPTFELRERVINEVVDGKLFLQSARIDRMRSMLRDLIIFDLGRPDADRTIYADSGHMAFNEAQTDLYLTLYDGSMYERDANDAAMGNRTIYGKQVIRVEGVSNELERGGGSGWRGDREMNIAMMKDQVRERRARLAELADSTADLLHTLAPVVSAEPGRSKTSPTSEGQDSASASHHDSLSAAEEAPRSPPSAAPAAATSAADSTVAPKRKPSYEALKARLAPRRSSMPPEGDPVAFAAHIRSELQRVASHRDMQHRELNRYAVEIQKKFAIPVAAIVFVLIGAPIGVRFPRGGIGMVIGVSLTVFSVYYVFLIGGEELADRDFITPFWAMWAPNVLFTIVGGIIFTIVTRSGTGGHWSLVAWLHGRFLPSQRSGNSADSSLEGDPA
ncbi:MAG: LptF/LptG family permease [Gemmatimonadota bacterium]|nr:MAG: LptF/LptG family permease [Gemmatimonadota bacterium]